MASQTTGTTAGPCRITVVFSGSHRKSFWCLAERSELEGEWGHDSGCRAPGVSMQMERRGPREGALPPPGGEQGNLPLVDS